MPVDVTGAMPDAGSPVMWGDEEAGEMRFAGRDGIALALLRLDAVKRQASAEVPLRAGEHTLDGEKARLGEISGLGADYFQRVVNKR